MKAPPSGKLARSAVGGLALAQAGLAHLGHKARTLTVADQDLAQVQEQHEAELGKILFKALNQLKGTALKVSQMLSVHADFLPAGVRQQLAKGCYQVTPLNRALVHKVFRQEFGCAPEQLFARFDAQSFAAASLGQVHHAQLADGSFVAVKVQYPGIASAINSDLRMLRTLLSTLGMGAGSMPRKELVDQMMTEVGHKLAEELDYRHEAAQLNWFRQHVTLPGLRIPQPLASHSTKCVLTMERLDGLHVDEWLATNPSQERRDHFGQLLFDWFCYSAFELGRLHADPHPGNFLFLDDGTLGVLDFGCTKTIAPAFCASLLASWRALKQRHTEPGRAAARLAYIELKVISAGLSEEEFVQQLLPALSAMIGWQLEPFAAARFDFGTRSPLPLTERAHAHTIGRLMSGMHEDLPYFDRAYVGVTQLLKKIGARVVTENRWINLN
jgi:predicted unusual protein kinase regulating ubiquinone biosynthesis (AarF/ABC1/UbiB family)